MDKKILLGLLLGSFALLALAILIPSGKVKESAPRHPWRIHIGIDGNSSVFGLTIGQSTLGEAQKALQAEPQVNLFATPEGDYSIEAFFRRLAISGLKADLVLSLAIDPSKLEGMYQRGARQKALETGNKQIDLASEDYALMSTQKIAYITYIPSANLDEAMIEARFGAPSSIEAEEEGSIVHWLYPTKGLDIALNPEGKEVFQYVNPRDFARVVQPFK